MTMARTAVSYGAVAGSELTLCADVSTFLETRRRPELAINWV
jgi:hypothetical protein